MKQAFAMITATIFMSTMAYLTLELMEAGQLGVSKITSEYTNAQARMFYEQAAHDTVARWLGNSDKNDDRLDHKLCENQGRGLGDKALEGCTSLQQVGEYANYLAPSVDNANYKTTFSAKKVQQVGAYELYGAQPAKSLINQIKTKDNSPLFNVIISKLIYRSHSLGNAPSYTNTASDLAADYLLNSDFSTADFRVCISTKGTILEDIAPATYCDFLTLNN